MKRIAHLILTIFVASFTFIACQKELTDPNGSTTPGDFRAKINGVQWVASVSSATRLNGLISLVGAGSGKQIAITLQDSGVHHYTLDQTSLQVAAYSDSASGSIYAFTTNQGNSLVQPGGSIDITSIDTANKKISGAFRFTVYRAVDSAQRTISEGSFTNITYATNIGTGAPTDSFMVKIDSIDFTPFSIHGIHLTASSQITVVGSDQAGVKSVSLFVPESVVPGTFPITTVGGTYSGLYNKDAATYLPSDSGSVTILEHNISTNRIRGNFNFHAKQFPTGSAQAQLTVGYFAVTYQ